MRADQVPMWPTGLHTRVCRSCRNVTALPTCGDCGSETKEARVYNSQEADARSRWGLTVREAEVMSYVSAGLTNSEIASRLTTSEKTTKELLSRARSKMGAGNRVQAARMWWEAERRAA
jgi:DNA-binding NarL/FixJ family response regulator